MSVEYLKRKIDWLETKMAASLPVWNTDDCCGKRNLIRLKSKPHDGREENVYQLGEAQFGVLQLIVKGLKVVEIAELMGVSFETVKTHKDNLAQKFDVFGGRISLFAKLVHEVILSFEPVIPEENWLGIRESNP